MKVLIDTNVLCRLAAKDHALHGVATHAVSTLRGNGHELCIVPQVLYEYWVVATRPASHNGLNLTPASASTAIDLWCDLFTLFRDERGIFGRWRELVQHHSVSGKGAHDARLVAAMQRHGLTQLLTFNIADFQRYQDIEPLDPMAVVAAS